MYPNIILFDGICNLCNGVVCFLIKRDKKAVFRFMHYHCYE
ncbi:DCC1-like thiol-disulfide oxidoreductase family protein [Parabacteroides chinchillae]|nr:DCC1-like thiol-disulfide oxidoreductase family protein [Parabacteroides chinchillae]